MDCYRAVVEVEHNKLNRKRRTISAATTKHRHHRHRTVVFRDAGDAAVDAVERF